VELLHSVVLNFDRYLDALTTPAPDHDALQQVALACLCTGLKFLEGDPEVGDGAMAHQYQLRLISRNQVPLQDIYRTEATVLGTLGFVMELPTPASFLACLLLTLEARSGFSSGIAAVAKAALFLALRRGDLLYSMVRPVACLRFGEGTPATYEPEPFCSPQELFRAP